MTHTTADAEAAIARHPESLEQLSMAADLLQELNDPRGEDFAACLGGEMSAEDLMRKWPADASAMFVAAWVIGNAAWCARCGDRGTVWVEGPSGSNEPTVYPEECPWCKGSSRGKYARAEALRLLAACGISGYESKTGPGSSHYQRQGVSADWVAETIGKGAIGAIPRRLALLDAYAAADPDTRRRWAEETRALAVKPLEATV